jgi:hypothetical protein
LREKTRVMCSDDAAFPSLKSETWGTRKNVKLSSTTARLMRALYAEHRESASWILLDRDEFVALVGRCFFSRESANLTLEFGRGLRTADRLFPGAAMQIRRRRPEMRARDFARG